MKGHGSLFWGNVYADKAQYLRTYIIVCFMAKLHRAKPLLHISFDPRLCNKLFVLHGHSCEQCTVCLSSAEGVCTQGILAFL